MGIMSLIMGIIFDKIGVKWLMIIGVIILIIGIILFMFLMMDMLFWYIVVFYVVRFFGILMVMMLVLIVGMNVFFNYLINYGLVVNNMI